MNKRRIVVTLGITTLVCALLVIGFPELFAFSTSEVVISLIGILALVQAVRVMQDRRKRSAEDAAKQEPEQPIPTPAPGDVFENEVKQFLSTRRLHFYRDRIRDGLQAATVEVLTQYDGYSPSEAEDAVEDGTWTSDRHAAGFLGGDDAPSPPFRVRLRDMVRGSSPTDRDIQHSVLEIADRAGVKPAPDGSLVHNPRHRERTSATEADDTSTFDSPADSVPTDHWGGIIVVALVGIGIGVLADRPAIVLASIAGIGFAAYGRSAIFPPGNVTIDRSISDDDPTPGDEIDVMVTVTNDSGRFLPDIRIIDGVPDILEVTTGSPRHGTALRSGEQTTFSYAVRAARGEHAFREATVFTRDLPSAQEQEDRVGVETSITCTPELRPLAEPVPLRTQATQFVGRVQTSSGGEGVEFFATREYRPNDAMRRIDWNRHARTGELTTVEYREERAATVVIMIDARMASYVSPEPNEAHTVDRSVEAAGKLFTSLGDAGDQVGLAAIGLEPCWLPPGSGTDHRVRAREVLATHPTLTPVPPEERPSIIRWRNQFRKRLAPATQLLFISPLCDDFASRFARQFDEYGYPVTIVSPDPTTDRSTGHLLSRVARELRIADLRSAEIPVIDWSWDEPVDAAVARHNEGWSR